MASLSFIAALAVSATAEAAPAAKATLGITQDGGPGAWDVTEVDAGKGQICIAANAKADDSVRIELAWWDAGVAKEIPAATFPETHAWDGKAWKTGPLCATVPKGGQDYVFAKREAGALKAFGSTSVKGVVTNDGGGGGGGGGGKDGTGPSSELSDAVIAAAIAAAPKDHVVRRNYIASVGADVTLYFLPNGEPIAALPKDLTERDEITIKVLVPVTDKNNSSKVVYSLTACPDRDRTRVSGDFNAVKSAVGQFHSKTEPPIQIVEQKLDVLDCGAGDVSFSIKTSYGEKATTLKLQPVYFATFGVQFTFDFTKNGSLGTTTNAAGQTIITRNRDVLGPKVVPVVMLSPFGSSFDHPTLLGILLNPTLGFDLDNLTNSFYVGNSVCGLALCLAAGVHLRQVDEFASSSGLVVGGPYDTSKGALPTTKAWQASNGGTGAYVGLTLDVRTALKLAGKALN